MPAYDGAIDLEEIEQTQDVGRVQMNGSKIARCGAPPEAAQIDRDHLELAAEKLALFHEEIAVKRIAVDQNQRHALSGDGVVNSRPVDLHKSVGRLDVRGDFHLLLRPGPEGRSKT